MTTSAVPLASTNPAPIRPHRIVTRPPSRPWAPTRPPSRPATSPSEDFLRSRSDLRCALAQGQHQAWRQVYDRYRGLVKAIARRVVTCEADIDEVTQLTFVQLWTHAEQLVDIERLPGWLATTARREALAIVKARSREVPTDCLRDDAIIDTAHPEELLYKELLSALHLAINALPTHQRRVVQALLAGDGCYDDVSRLLGIPRGSIGPTRARAVEALRAVILPAFG